MLFWFFISNLIFSSSFSYANIIEDSFEKILTCESSFDPYLQQGEMVRFHVYYSLEHNQSFLLSRPDVGPEVMLLEHSNSTRSIFEIDNSHITLEWEQWGQSIYASLVYIGSWVLAMDINSEMKAMDPSLMSHDEVTLFCQETPQFSDFFL